MISFVRLPVRSLASHVFPSREHGIETGILRHERLVDQSRGARDSGHSGLGNSPINMTLFCFLKNSG